MECCMKFNKKLLNGLVNLSLNVLPPSPEEHPLFDEMLEIMKSNNNDFFTKKGERFDNQAAKNERRNWKKKEF